MGEKHSGWWGSRAMRVLERAKWVPLALLIPLTIFVALSTPGTSVVMLLLWLMLALVTITYAIIIQTTSEHAHAELAKAKEHNATDREQLVTILNSMSVGIMSVSKQGTIQLYNAALLSLLDTNESLRGKKVSDALKTFDSKNAPIDLMDIVAKSYLTKREDIVLKYGDGDKIRLRVVINPIRSSGNKLSGYIFIIEDITKTKNLEEERDEFISVVSHELRTPITIAEGSISNAQLLLKRGTAGAVLEKPFEDAHQQIVFLGNMVNDLGALSRAERGIGDEREAVDIDTLAGDLHVKYEPRARERGLHFNLNIVGHIGSVTTSKLYLEEVLQNFITNAIKYTQKGSVSLHIRKTADGVIFAVKDTGIGISTSDQKHVFEKFYRSEDYRTRETSGTGLGLYVVQKLARKLGVKLEVSSRLNHGSTFSFTIPLQ